MGFIAQMFAAFAAFSAFLARAFSFLQLFSDIILVSKLHDASPEQIKKFENIIHFKKNNSKFIKPKIKRLLHLKDLELMNCLGCSE